MNENLKDIEDSQTGIEYRIEKLLKRTAFATIYLVQARDGTEYACKVYSRQSLQKRKYFEILEREISILKNVKHQNVLEPSHIFKDFDNYYILTHFCTDGSLDDLMRQRKRLTEEEIELIVFELLKALQYFRAEHIIHRDLKPENVLLQRIFPSDTEVYEELRVRVIDFGLAFEYAKNSTEAKRFTFCGSPSTLAPEVIFSHIFKRLRDKMQVDSSLDAECVEVAKMIMEREILIKDRYERYESLESGYKYEVDMWGLGCTMYFLMYGEMPFRAGKDSVLYEKALRGDYIINTSLNPELSQECINYMEHLLRPNKNDRFTLEQALDADWISHGAMVRLRFLPEECACAEFCAKEFYKAQPDIYQFGETLTERIQLERANKIQKPIFIPTLDISDAIKGLGLLKIKLRAVKVSARVYPYQHRVSITQYLIKNFYSFVFDGVEQKLPNPVKFPPLLLEDKLFHKRTFDEFVASLDNIGRKVVQNYLIYRSDAVENALIENDLTSLPKVIFDPELVIAATNSERYGSAYLFEDGTFAFSFNDGTTLVISSNDVYIDYYGESPATLRSEHEFQQKKQHFRCKSRFFQLFFDKEKESVAKHFKSSLKEQIRLERAVKISDTPENLESCEISTSDSEASSTSKRSYEYVKPSICELESTLDLFLEPFFDLLYDDVCRYFHTDVSASQATEFSAARHKALTRGKCDLNDADFEFTSDIPNVIVIGEEKVLNLVLEDIIAALVENEHAHFGNNAIISHIAAAIDLNTICLNALQRPMQSVNAQIRCGENIAFRLSSGEFQVNYRQTSVLITHQHATFTNECDKVLAYPLQYFDNEAFRFQFGKDKIADAVKLSSQFGI